MIWLSDKVEEGGSVDAGDVLVRIDPAEAQSALDTAQADLTEAEADLRDAERALGLAADEITAAEDQSRLRANALARQQDLLERGVGSTAAVETAELALSSPRRRRPPRRGSIRPGRHFNVGRLLWPRLNVAWPIPRLKRSFPAC